MRRAVIDRKTRETQVRIRLGIEGKGRYDVRTGIRFLDHMLEALSRHSGIGLAIAESLRLMQGIERDVEESAQALSALVAEIARQVRMDGGEMHHGGADVEELRHQQRCRDRSLRRGPAGNSFANELKRRCSR